MPVPTGPQAPSPADAVAAAEAAEAAAEREMPPPPAAPPYPPGATGAYADPQSALSGSKWGRKAQSAKDNAVVTMQRHPYGAIAAAAAAGFVVGLVLKRW